ncbi:hypothetical protein D3C84_709850 [compost metagenome]
MLPRLGATKPWRCISGMYRWVNAATEPPMRSAGSPVTLARSSRNLSNSVLAKIRVTSSQSLRLYLASAGLSSANMRLISSMRWYGLSMDLPSPSKVCATFSRLNEGKLQVAERRASIPSMIRRPAADAK